MDNQQINENNFNENVVMKTKKKMTKSKMVAMAVMGVLGALAIAIILMAIIPKNYASGLPSYLFGCSSTDSDAPSYVYIYEGSSTAKEVLYKDSDAKFYNELMEAFDKSFSQSSLSALFQKELSNDIDYDYIGTNSKTLSNIASENQYVLGFTYADYQTLTKNGKDYVCKELSGSSAYEDGIVKFKTLWITVNNVEGVSDVNIYVRRILPDSETNYAIIKISTKGLQSQLSKTVADIILEKN